ncbi:MAG: lipid IV(A) 3-deoxy-D-manno-octulosonic acid transferase [Gammaproteobacteria bacterium]|nr:lipid IV(A) 3-deoxy-D-manno-octulosonic acid transferase [Gammaproteobacteria bacterium]
MRQLYSLLLWLLLPGLLIWLWLRRDQRPTLAQRLGFYSSAEPAFYWVHAASVGEVLAARPLIEAMLQRFPQRSIVVTTFTRTGADFVASSFGARVQHAYLPIDLGPMIGQFLRKFQPRCAIFLETELWPNMLASLQRRGIKTMIANGRISPATARRYQQFSALFAPLLAKLDVVAVQSNADATSYQLLGVPASRLAVLGNLKYDLQLPANTDEVAKDLRQQWRGRQVLLAASTRDGEEAALLELYPRLRQRFPQLLLVLVPRHPQRFESVAALVLDAGLSLCRRSEASPVPCQQDVFLGDTLGELPGFYAAADVIFIGGSLAPLGGHNPLEAAAVGKAVLVGEHTFNFAEVYVRLEQQDAVRRATGLIELAQLFEQQLANPHLVSQMGERARQVMVENRGGVNQTLARIAQLTP